MSINVSVAGLQGRVRCGGAAVYAKHTRPTRMPGPAVWPGWRDREGGETRDLGSKRVLGSTLRYYYRYYRSFDAREGKSAATAREEARARCLARAIRLPSAICREAAAAGTSRGMCRRAGEQARVRSAPHQARNSWRNRRHAGCCLAVRRLSREGDRSLRRP